MTAYRKTHSCETTLLGLIEDWKQVVDSKQLVCVLSTDMSKAFDCLSHFLTIKKLEAYGFGSGSLDLMRSFFENKRNRVKLGEITRDCKLMKRGCPPGSSFRSLLWNMFQNDVPSHVENGNVNMYADDHQLHVKGTNHEIVRRQLKTSSKQTLTWYSKNFLLANPEKFQFLNINPRKIDGYASNAVRSADGLPIDKSGDIKLLGVHIDDDLNFKKHMSELCIMTSHKLGIIESFRF